MEFQLEAAITRNIDTPLLMQGAEYGAVLSITVNDMGNYGCYPDCLEEMSSPLFSEATVNLIKRRPMTSLVAHCKYVSNR